MTLMFDSDDADGLLGGLHTLWNLLIVGVCVAVFVRGVGDLPSLEGWARLIASSLIGVDTAERLWVRVRGGKPGDVERER